MVSSPVRSCSPPYGILSQGEGGVWARRASGSWWPTKPSTPRTPCRHGQGTAIHPRAGAYRPHGHSCREPAHRAVVDSRLDDPGAARSAGALSPHRCRRRRAQPRQEATDRLSNAVRPFLLRPEEDRPSIAPDLPERTVTDLAVPLTTEQVSLYEAEVREALHAIATKFGYRAPRPRATTAHGAEADLQPPGAVPPPGRATFQVGRGSSRRLRSCST